MDYKLYYSKYKGSEVDAAIDQIPNKLDKSAKGVANGVASLGADGKVPENQLPQIDSGKVDTVSVNGGTPIQPDASKNINITISKTTVGLGNVDNTSDKDKPVSTAQQTELNKKLDKTGGAISGDLSVSGKLTVQGNDIHTDIYTDILPKLNGLDNIVSDKLDKPSNAGAAGQVLTKTASGSEWKDVEKPDVTAAGNNTFTGENTFEDIYANGNLYLDGENSKIQVRGADYEFPESGGTIALTRNIPDTTDFAAKTGENEFTGDNFFTQSVNIVNGSGVCVFDTTAIEDYKALYGANSIRHTYYNNDGSFVDKTYKFPSGGGTLATTDEIPDTANFVTKDGDNSFIGNNTFKVDSLLTAGSSSYGPTSNDELIITRTTPTPGKEFMSLGFVPNGNNPKPAIKAQASNSPKQSLFTFPTEKAASTYTLATTDDIPDTSNFVTTDGTNHFNGENSFDSEGFLEIDCQTTIKDADVIITHSNLNLNSCSLQADGVEFAFPKTGGTFATTDDGITIIEKTGISVPTTESMPAADLGLTDDEKTTIDGKDLSLISFNINGMMFYYSGDYKYDQYIQELPSTSTGKNYFLQIVLETQNTPYVQSGSVKLVTVESGGGGDVTAAGTNTFTGLNTFNSNLTAKYGVAVPAFSGAAQTTYGSGTISVRNSSLYTKNYVFPEGTGSIGGATNVTVATTDDVPVVIAKTASSYPSSTSSVSISFTSAEMTEMSKSFDKCIIKITFSSNSITYYLYPQQTFSSAYPVYIFSGVGDIYNTLYYTMRVMNGTGALSLRDDVFEVVAKTTTSTLPSSSGSSVQITYTNTEYLNLFNYFEKYIIKITSSSSTTAGSIILYPQYKRNSGNLDFSSVPDSSGGYYYTSIIGTPTQTVSSIGFLYYKKPAVSAATLNGTTLNITLG